MDRPFPQADFSALRRYIMAVIDLTCPVRKPGPFAGQVRLCQHIGPNGRCQTKLSDWHEGPVCFAHEQDHFLHLGIPIRPKAA